jgi:hypothetical protein
MLVQDHLTGQLHEVADEATYGYGDPGYGFPALLPILGKLAPMVLPQLFSSLTSGMRGNAGYAGSEYAGYGSPEYEGYGEEPIAQGQVVYDGFGNPVGFAPLVNIAKSVLPKLAPVAQSVARAVPGLVRSIVPAATQALRSVMPAAAPRMPMSVPMRALPMPMPVPVPAGWRRPPVPYTGARPARAYMRCSVWPGQPGLVPTALTAVPGVPVPGAAPMMPVRRRRRRR